MRGRNRRLKKRVVVLILVCLWVITAAIFLINLETPRVATQAESPPAIASPAATAGVQPEQPVPAPPEPVVEPAPPLPVPPAAVPPAASPPPDMPGEASAANLNYLREKKLLIPVMGVIANQLRDSFLDARSEGRVHQALDIMAPQGTAVLATTDGKVMKLYQSDRGGIMLYQADASGPYVYYYGHLSGYADGITEGKQVRRGEVIAYVGDTGNAGAGNYHLHFGISKITAPGKWSGGEPINPFPLLAGR